MAWLDKRGVRFYLKERLADGRVYSKPLGKVSPRKALKERLAYEDKQEGDQMAAKDLGQETKVVYQAWLDHFDRENFSPKTKKAAKPIICEFLRPFRRIGEITPEKIKIYADNLYAFKNQGGKGYAIDTIANRLRNVSSFCSWLEKEGYAKESPFKTTIPQGRKDAGRALEGYEVHKLFKCWPRPRIYNGRLSKHDLSKLFFLIVFYGGCRLTEILGDPNDIEHFPGLQHEDVIYDRCVIKLQKTKARQRREVALPKTIIRLIPKRTGPVFRSKIGPRALHKHWTEAAKIAGIVGRFRIHDGRVTAATEWLRQHPDIKSAMDQFGWKSERMAVHYNKVATDRRVKMAQQMTYES